MQFVNEIGTQNLLTVAGVVVGAVILFWLLHKIVRFVMTLVIVSLVAAVALVFCVKAGYLSRETAERINPLKSERIRQAMKEAGAWAGDRAKDAAKKAISAAIDETVAGAVPTNAPQRKIP